MKNFAALLVVCMGLSFLGRPGFSAQYNIEKAWELAPGSRPYVTDAGHFQRGMAFNPKTGHLLLVNRAGDAGTAMENLKIAILDAANGAEIGFLDLSALTSGGNRDFPISLIGVAEDGAIYAINLSNSTTSPQVNVYRWENEGAPQAHIYAGDPGQGNVQRWGDTFDVRGAGAGTQLLLGSRGNIASIFTTTDGVNFEPRVVTLDSLAGSIGYGVAFGSDNTFWGTSGASSGGPLRHYAFNLANGTATTLRTYSFPSVPRGLTPLDVDASRALMAGLVIERTDSVDLYDIGNLQSAPVVMDREEFPSNNENGVFAGSVQLAGNRLYVLNNNNGIVAYDVKAGPEIAPALLTTIPSQAVPSGSTVLFQAAVMGSTPLAYQWLRNDSPLSGATNSMLVISNVQSSAAGDYKLVVSNAVGTAASEPATLTLTDPPAQGRLQLLWSIAAGSRPYISNSGSSQRGMAYNHVTDHVLVPNRSGALSIPILNGQTGEEIGNLMTTGISGGSVSLTQLAVADDGAIYGVNLVTTTTLPNFKIYRWENEQATPAVIVTDVTTLEPQRWGDTFDVRGAGDKTELLLGAGTGSGAGTGATVLLVTTPNGLDFVPMQLTVDAPPLSFAHGISFGEGDTFWGKALDGSLYHVRIDRQNGIGKVISSYTDSSLSKVTSMDIHPGEKLMGGITVAAPDQFFLFDISNTNSAPVKIDEATFLSDNGNSTATGAVEFGGDKVMAYDTNNGLLMFKLRPNQPPSAPALSIGKSSGQVTITWPASAQGYVLESSARVGPGASWLRSPAVPVVQGTNLVVSLAPTESAQFFRLKK